MEKIVRQLMSTLDSPMSLKVAILMRYGEWDQIANLSIDPHDYLERDFPKFKKDLQAIDLLRKCVSMPTTFDRKGTALESFRSAERTCSLTNAYLRYLADLPRPCLDGSDLAVVQFLDACKKKIARILGPAPRQWEGRFGPGSTFEAKWWSAVHITAGDKLQNTSCWTGNWNTVIKGLPPTLYRHAFLSQWCQGNRFTSVPKNAKTFRGICIEPGMNIFSQLGLGAIIRRRLKLWGIDLDYGQHLHADLACLGSKTGNWCTIDLESASDTVSRELVRWLLPSQWFRLLDDLRSKRTLVDGRWFRLEKFSSMGNGFTFELESLIFAAIASVASGHEIGEEVFVYGDDIIVPTETFADVSSALRVCGFKVNRRKTFASSLFRESCGGQFFNGLQIETCKLENFPSEPPDWFSFHNALYRFDAYLTRSSRNEIRQQLPRELRPITGPVSWGDSVLHGIEPMQVKVRGGTPYAPYIRLLVRTVGWQHFLPHVHLSLALLGYPSTGGIATREVAGFKKGWRCIYGHATWPWIPGLA